MLIRAQPYWPEYMSTMLWPFALLAGADRINNLHIDMKGMTPKMKISSVAGSSVKLKNYHTVGCPVYILDAILQNRGRSWSSQVRFTLTIGHLFGIFSKSCW